MVQLFKNFKAMLLVSAVLLVLLIISACGGTNVQEQAGENKPANTQQTENNKAESAEASESATTKKVTDDLGREVEVPVDPQRIIAGEFASELLAVGLKPIGAGDNSFKIVYTLDQMEGVEPIGDPPNIEKILDLQPDLIVAPTVFFEIYPEQMEQMNKIAPVFYLSFEQDPIYGIFTKLASLVGKEQEADTWIKGYEEEANTARAQLKESLGEETVSIFRVEKGRLRIYLNRNFAGYMLHSGLQANAPETVKAEIEKNPFSSAIEISLEMLPEYAADHMLLIVRDEGDDKSAMEEIEQLELWRSLPAVKNKRVHKLETEKYYGSDITTIRETMKETLKMLTGGKIQ
ncbi:iron complex transport system substrate-binding protein [Paenibacillus algorifonticola]|uniref:Iron complex transport system substrate-binding protein n=1 Tax=Paenibacillus algorifonticola TaxID=684063 RepID=A0A1I2ADV0_9BACL|nr:ABC transporter substrate-binding protein [Paenibacillus algorifonticola]SFE42076.1 iron complex transport system substrate-binding protein [Paenibacillus algorifonticola]